MHHSIFSLFHAKYPDGHQARGPKSPSYKAPGPEPSSFVFASVSILISDIGYDRLLLPLLPHSSKCPTKNIIPLGLTDTTSPAVLSSCTSVMDNPAVAADTLQDPFNLLSTAQHSPPYPHDYGYGVADVRSGSQQQDWADHLQANSTRPRAAAPLRSRSAATGSMRGDGQQAPRMTSVRTRQHTSPRVRLDALLEPGASRISNTPDLAAGTPPATKRQRTSASSANDDLEIDNMFNTTYRWRRNSVDSSQCCSSCSEGEPCAEPECEIQKEAVIACMQSECKQPPCPDECLRAALGGDTALYQGIVSSSSRLSDWNCSTWNPQLQRSSSQMPADLFKGTDLMDPTGQAGELQSPSGPSSSLPTPTSVVNHLVTPFSPSTALATPQSMNCTQTEQSSASSSILSGAGMMFGAQSSQWGEQNLENATLGNDSSMFNCEWSGCAQPFANQQEWTDHIHVAHVDPQMSFYCPVPTENCALTIGRHPIHHLVEDHGFNFLMSNEFSCPAPDCNSEQVFLNPKMLHNHFDQAHAIPATGSFVCQWNSCDTAFSNPHELFDHLNSKHRITTLLGSGVNASPLLNGELGGPYPSIIPDLIPSEDDDAGNVCKWKTENGSTCGTICETEKELQAHVKQAHLKSLSSRVGYNCQWQGCSRPAKLGNKAGFTARGKLERHMASHTGCKGCHLTPEIVESC